MNEVQRSTVSNAEQKYSSGLGWLELCLKRDRESPKLGNSLMNSPSLLHIIRSYENKKLTSAQLAASIAIFY